VESGKHVCAYKSVVGADIPQAVRDTANGVKALFFRVLFEKERAFIGAFRHIAN
jgi:hypothetical protein